jgi:hypothetical protein
VLCTWRCVVVTSSINMAINLNTKQFHCATRSLCDGRYLAYFSRNNKSWHTKLLSLNFSNKKQMMLTQPKATLQDQRDQRDQRDQKDQKDQKDWKDFVDYLYWYNCIRPL